MSGDDFSVNVTSDTESHFKAALRMLFEGYGTKSKTASYKIDERGLVLYAKVVPGSIPLAYEMDAEWATAFAWGWLKEIDYSNYSQKPDPDEGPRKGFRVQNEPYGKCEDIIAIIKPFWMEYSK